ncbi:unnamed protein product [Euphydryas editha]|uniref:N-terminal Ras-GEF domain-containing protein n=1 Tax=Euphydryas editha TaxID=104508 RepID=A0AAU9UK24_EUPED|nr:unnamed protein product [Euphydryas editha]
MAYMEMFGNCSHTLNAHPPINPEAPPDMFRHSIHTYNLTSAQHSSTGTISVGHHQLQRTLASSLTVQHLSTPPLSGSEDSVSSMKTSSRTSPVPPEPPALPPKMNKTKQISMNSSNELLPPPSPRPSSNNSSADESMLNNVSSDDLYVSSSSPGKFPVDEEELDRLVPLPSPVPSQRSENSTEPVAPATESNNAITSDSEDIILQTDVSAWLLLKGTTKEGTEIREVRGGHPDALIVLATKATKDFAYQEAFLATYRTWVSPGELVRKLVRRAHHYRPRAHDLRSTLGLLTRVVADLT